MWHRKEDREMNIIKVEERYIRRDIKRDRESESVRKRDRERDRERERERGRQSAPSPDLFLTGLCVAKDKILIVEGVAVNRL